MKIFVWLIVLSFTYLLFDHWRTINAANLRRPKNPNAQPIITTTGVRG